MPRKKSRSLLFIGERRSLKAIQMNVTWHDGRLAAKPLFEALEVMGLNPNDQKFVNLFVDPPKVPAIDPVSVETLRRARRPLVAMGQKVARVLQELGIPHVAIVHPAARGRIRKRSRYIRHVQTTLAEVVA